MKGERAFFDTNILIYALAKDDPRSQIAESLLARGGVIGVQALNEFAALSLRKLGRTLGEVKEALDAVRVLCPAPVPLTVEVHEAALRIMRRYGYAIYDALVIAAALEAGCGILFSEDLQDGQVIDGLTIRDPFREIKRQKSKSKN